MEEAAAGESESTSWLSPIAGYASLAGLLYAIGLLIFNINLGAYGIASVDLGRPEYILVGALWATLNAMWLVAWLQFNRIVLNGHKGMLFGSDVADLVFYFLTILAAWGILHVYGQIAPINTERMSGIIPVLFTIVWMFLSYIAVQYAARGLSLKIAMAKPGVRMSSAFYLTVLSLETLVFLFRGQWILGAGTLIGVVLAGLKWRGVLPYKSAPAQTTPDTFRSETGESSELAAKPEQTPQEPNRVIAFVIFVLLSLFSLFFYTIGVFPFIPSAFGGGAEPLIQLVFTHDAPSSTLAQLPMSPVNMTTEPVPELLETDKTIVVNVYGVGETGSAVEIRKDFVAAIIHPKTTVAQATARNPKK